MFFAIHQTPPEYAGALRKMITDWAGAEERFVYLAGIDDELERRKLSAEELARLEAHFDRAAQQIEYGGFVAGQTLGDLNGLSFFELDEKRERARLVAFVANDKLLAAETPLQSPLLLLPFERLMRDEQAAEWVYFPFHEITQEDFIRFGLYHFAPATEPGWWQQANILAEIADLMALPLEEGKPIEKWLEFKMQVEPDVLDFVTRLFARHGYMQRTITERATSDGQNIDTESAAILTAYLPDTPAGRERLQALATALNSLAVLRPMDKLYVTERSKQYWEQVWGEQILFRVGRRLVLTPEHKDYVPAADEIYVEIPPSRDVFSLDLDGAHSSTLLSLELLEKHFDPAQHKKVLDLGTGSGVLSIVAVRLGAQEILALDAYPPAIDAARQNLARNGIHERVTLAAGSLAVRPRKEDTNVYSFEEDLQRPPDFLAEWLPFDAILCNTYDHVLIALTDALFEALRPGGMLISSGILSSRADAVNTALEQAGLKFLDRQDTPSWTGFVHLRPA
jgi:ribosomal protein L11 methyltransferase